MVRRASIAANRFLTLSAPHPSAILQSLKVTRIARFQSKDILRALNNAVSIQFLDALFAKSFDIEGVARDEMLEAFARLSRADQSASATPDRIFFPSAWIHLSDSVTSTSRTNCRKDIWHELAGRFSSTTSITLGITSPAR